MLLTYGAINKNNQVRIQQVYDLHGHKIFQRFRWEPYNSYSSWEQIFPDYSEISLNSIGYIIFTNKISILWGRTYDNIWEQNQSGTYHQVISLPINITNQYRQFVSSSNLASGIISAFSPSTNIIDVYSDKSNTIILNWLVFGKI